MAHFTITIKTLIKNNFDFQLNEYPIFDENYRDVLNNKILNFYYEDEIGFETAPLFRRYLKNQMNLIMPYYNELYKIQKKILDNDLSLNNVDLSETKDLSRKNTANSSGDINNTSNATQNGETSSSSTGKSVLQDTPQGKIWNTDIDNLNWATQVNHDKSNSNSTDKTTANTTQTQHQTSENNLNGTENYVKHIIGANGNKYKIELLQDVKNNIMNIDQLIINDLSELFMGIY